MYLFNKSYNKQLHNIYLKTQRNPATSVRFEIDRLANDDEELASDLMDTYTNRYGYPDELIAKNGYVYFMRAEGFYGIFAWLICRYKIGKSNNPKRRHIELNGQQAPCPINVIRYIQVDDMSAVETALHKKYAKNRKHGEWFIFWTWELPLVHLAYDHYARSFKVNKMGTFSSPKKIVVTATVFVVLFVASALIASNLITQPTPTNQYTERSIAK